jgi:hypothetical protein
MSVGVFRAANLDAIANAPGIEEVRVFRDQEEWSPERFAHEQIRGLVRQVFFSGAAQPVRQVVFSAIEAQTDVTYLCRLVGEALASQIRGSVVILTRDEPMPKETWHEDVKPEVFRPRAAEPVPLPLRDIAERVRANLWMLTESKALESRSGVPAPTALYSRLCELRSEFDYSIVQGPAAGLSSEATVLGQLTDGIVLVLTAYKTRRAAAKKITEMLANTRTRVLGTVLVDRTFPIPSALYRRL